MVQDLAGIGGRKLGFARATHPGHDHCDPPPRQTFAESSQLLAMHEMIRFLGNHPHNER